MGRQVGKAKFFSGEVKYCIYQRTTDVFCNKLFNSIDEAIEAMKQNNESESVVVTTEAINTERPVYLFSDCDDEEYNGTGLASIENEMLTVSSIVSYFDIDWIYFYEQLVEAKSKIRDYSSLGVDLIEPESMGDDLYIATIYQTEMIGDSRKIENLIEISMYYLNLEQLNLEVIPRFKKFIAEERYKTRI